MKLLTEAVKKALPALYSNESKTPEDTKVPVKFFCPWGSYTWYATEGSPVDENGTMIPPEDTTTPAVDFLCFGWVYGPEPELGYFSINELQDIKGGPGRALGIERDLHWGAISLKEVMELGR